MKTSPFLNDDNFFKSVEMDEGGGLTKSKVAVPIGTVRSWDGKNYIKTESGWKLREDIGEKEAEKKQKEEISKKKKK